jgi:ATP-binding cassette subfamily G (WHITE) protein 2 (SNQ2)
LFFVCWYWTVGFDSSRAGYTYLMYGIVFPMYYSTIGQVRFRVVFTNPSYAFIKATASMAPTAEIAAILFSLLFSFVILLYASFSLVDFHPRHTLIIPRL